MAHYRIDMVGARHGRLVGLRYAGRRGNHALWLFQCDCGELTVAAGAAVRCGKTASCGCLHRERSAARLTKHGRRAKKRHDATYRAWQEINTYCSFAGSPRFRDFGARGIAVCERWRDDFEAFLADMGERPPGTMLTRLDEAADFDGGNCCWAAVRSRAERARGERRPSPALAYAASEAVESGRSSRISASRLLPSAASKSEPSSVR